MEPLTQRCILLFRCDTEMLLSVCKNTQINISHICKPCSGLMHRRGACQFDIFLRTTVADHMASTAKIRVNVATEVPRKTGVNCLFAVKL